MENFRTLRILDRFSGFFTRLGADYPAMRKILAIKLTMDKRRVPTVFNTSRNKSKDEGNNENRFMKSLWVYALLGLLLVPFVLLGKNYLFQMSFLFGIMMFLVMTSMVSDFSSVLLDIRDKNILLTKPVNKKTLNIARAVHVSIYLLFLTGAIAAVPFVVGAVRQGILFSLLFLVSLILMDLFILVITAGVYFFILRFFDGEKLKDIINYVQILLTIVLAVGYQFIGRSFELIGATASFHPEWWQVFVPPVWFGSVFELLLNGRQSPFLIFLGVLALVVPLALFACYVKMMPAFERNLQKLSYSSGGKRIKNSSISNMLAALFCPNKEERVFYKFAGRMMKNEREFRLKVYPSLGFAIIIPFIIMLNKLRFESFASLAESKYYLSVYLSAVVIPTAVMMLKYSGKYKGAWIFGTAPLSSTAPLYSGTLKAFLVRLFLPIYLIISALFLFIFGFAIIPHLLVFLCASIVYSVLCTKLLKGSLPFSESFEAIQQSENWKTLIYLLPMAGFFGLHFGATFIKYGVLIYLGLMLVMATLVWKLAYNKLWVK